MDKLKKIIVALFLLISVVITFHNEYSSLLKEFEATAKNKEVMLSEHLVASSNFIKGTAIHSSIYLEQGMSKDSELNNLLQYDAERNLYTLDAIEGTDREKLAGNVTGMGKIPEGGRLRDELNFALDLNQFFSNYYASFPDVAWLYYTSENNFITMYPWVSSQDFSFSEKLKSVEFYTVATPSNNPQRQRVWTPVYLDEAGKGMMVTLSAPIYDRDTFKGVLSLDLTNVQLSKIIASEYESYLIDSTDTILAVSHNSLPNGSITKLDALLKMPPTDIVALKSLPHQKVARVGGSFVYSAGFSNAPWQLFLLLPVWLVAAKAAASTLPVLLISVLLLFSLIQVDKRKKTEVLLRGERELFSTTLFSVKEGIIVTDTAGKIILMNPIAEECSGWAKEEAIGKAFAEVLNLPDLATKEKYDENDLDPIQYVLLTAETLATPPNRGLLRRDGSEIYISGNAAGILEDSGKITGVVFSFRDTTKEYEQEKEIEGFLNINLDMLCVADTDGKFHKVNNKFKEILGYEANEVIGQSILSLIHEEDVPITLQAMKDLQEQKGKSGYINRFRCKDGTYKYMEWHNQPSGKYTYSSARDVTEKVVKEKSLAEIAIKDQLTGVFNRHYLDAIIRGEMATSDHYGQHFSLIIFDLDHFKAVNDTWGHPVGDEVLKQVALTVSQTIRQSDILIRFGGEEFLILLPKTSIHGAIVAAENIRLAIGKLVHPLAGRPTVSLGVAERIKGEAFESWYQRADEALYRAKNSGRNRLVAAEQEKRQTLISLYTEWKNDW